MHLLKEYTLEPHKNAINKSGHFSVRNICSSHTHFLVKWLEKRCGPYVAAFQTSIESIE
jgi:hypothetical protein